MPNLPRPWAGPADWVATVALGVISNNPGDTTESIGKDGSLIDEIQLTAFWARFLLLHLGGPNTITAYSIEDNELWLRHLLGLGVQTGVAVYIFLTAWTGSELSILSIPMFCVGIIKYGERTWVLMSSSNAQFRESILTPLPIIPNSCGSILQSRSRDSMWLPVRWLKLRQWISLLLRITPLLMQLS